MREWIKGILAGIIFLGLMIPNIHVAAAASLEKINYTAIGDSITVGYGLPDEKTGFVPQVGQALDATTVNLAVNGLTSAGLLEALQRDEMRKALEQADIISISIGSNDLLGPFSEIMMGVLGPLMTNPSSVNDLDTVIEKMHELTLTLNSTETVAIFKGQIEQFEKNWVALIAQLKTIAPQAKLLVNDLYNPYVQATIVGVPLGAYAEKYIPDMNKVLQKYVDKSYTLIPVYQAFQKSGLTNVDVKKFNYDPHPNQMGHDTLANLVKGTLGLPTMAMPETPSVQTKQVKTVLNGKVSTLKQKSLRINDRYYTVSASEVAEIVGARVSVNMSEQTMTVTKANKSLVVKLNEKQATINGKKVTLSTPVTMNGTHILVPVEAFTKAFGGSYRYDAKTNTLRVQVK